MAVSLAIQPSGAFAAAAAPPTGAFQGTFSTPQVLTVGGTVNINRGATTDIITIGSDSAASVHAVINWTPTDNSGSGPINFLPFGNVATFQNSGVVSDFTVLNRIIPVDGNRGIRFDGTVRSRINDVQGGTVWFYSPGGIIAGARSVFDVGGLVLTANNIDITGGLFGNPGTDNSIRFRGVSNSQSQVEIENGATIRANNYVALVAPRVVQSGTVTVDGSAGYIAADQVDVRINNGLFDIEFLEGTGARSNPIEHSGTTTGPGSTGFGDNQRIYLAAYPKNDAITVLVGGTLGYSRATSAFVENGQIVLSAGSSVSDIGLGGGGLLPSATAANISIGRDTTGDVSFTSSVIATATNDIVITPQSGATVSIDGSLNLSAGHRVEIGVDAGEAIIVGGTLNASNIGSAPDSELYLYANRAATATAPQGLISVGGDLFLRSTRDTDTARIRTIVDGGRINVAGQTRINASDFANGGGGNGVGGSAVIELLSAGSVFDVQDLSLFANATSRQSSDVNGNAVGGGSTGGNARVTITNGTFSARNVSLVTTSTNDVGNGGTGGNSLFEANGGITTLGNLSLLASAGIGGEGFGGRPADFVGDLKGGTASLAVTGGSLTVTGDLQLTASANALFQPASRGDIIGGQAGFSAATGSSLTIGGTATIRASGNGSGVDGQGVTDIARGGQIDLLASGGTITVGALDLEANATGSAAFSRGGDARGGNIDIRSTAGGVFAVNGTSMVRSVAQGGSGLTGGDATAGNITLLASGGTFDFAGETTLTATGHGGSAVESQLPLNGSGIRSGSGTGGVIDVQSGVLGGNGTSFTFINLIADAGGSSPIVTNNGAPIAGASGGTGTGGTVTFTVNSGVFAGDELAFSAGGSGGSGAGETTSASAGAGGAGTGGRITATFAGGSGNVDLIGLSSIGSGGSGGAGANDTGYGSIDAAGNGGSGTGGTLNLTLGSSAITVGSINLMAGGTGSVGGGSSSQVGGVGGTGTAGSARLLFVQDPTIPNITINTNTVGGVGGSGVTGGAGGNATNTTTAALDVTVGALTATTVSVSANATGGAGGQGTSGIGGVGGSASAGTARVSSNGASANLIAPNLSVLANAIGGNGAIGGAATGGIVSINGTGGALSSGRLMASATGTGGSGGFAFSGSGGAGGAGTGGRALVSNIQISGSDTSLSINTTGFGGAGGNGQSGGAGGDGFGGSGTNGGASLTQASGTINVDSGFSLLSDGHGGRGGNGEVFSSFGLPGGNGGNGTAGDVNVTLSGGATSLTTEIATLSASGFGGETGFNSSSPGVPVSPSGGSARGGSVTLSPSGGAAVTTSGIVSIVANATAISGQVGEANADSAGGNGGSAIAGTVLVSGSNGGFVANGSTTTISASAVAGNGGSGGTINNGGVTFIPGNGGNGGNATAGRVEATLRTDNAGGALFISAAATGGVGGLSNSVQGTGGNALAAANGGVFVTFDSGANATLSVEVSTTALGGDGRTAGNAIAGNSSITVSGANTSLTAPLVRQFAIARGGLGRNSTSGGSGGSATGGNASLSVSGAMAAFTSNNVTLNTAATAGNGGNVIAVGNIASTSPGGNGGAAISGSATLNFTDSNTSIAAIISDVSAAGGNAGQGVIGAGAPGTSGFARAGSFSLSQNGGTLARSGTDALSLILTANAEGGAGGAGAGPFSGTSGGTATGGNLSIAINSGSSTTPTIFRSSFNLASVAQGGNGGVSLSGTVANGGNGGNAFGGTNSLSVSGATTDITLTGLNLQSSAIGGNGGSGGSGGNGGDATQGSNTIAVTDQAILRLQQTQSIITTTNGGAGGLAGSLGNGGNGGSAFAGNAADLRLGTRARVSNRVNAFAGSAEQGISILVSQATLISDTLNLSANGVGGRGSNGGTGENGALFPDTGSNGNNGMSAVGFGESGNDGTAGGAGGNGGNGTNAGSGGVGGVGQGGSIRIEVNDGGSGLNDATFTTGNLSVTAQGTGGSGGSGAAGGNGEAGAIGGDGGIGGDGDVGVPGQDLGYGSFTPGGSGGNGGSGGAGGVGGNGGTGGNGGNGGIGGTARGGSLSLGVDGGMADIGALTANVDGRGGSGGLGGVAGLGALGSSGGRGGLAGLGAAGGFGDPTGAAGSDGTGGIAGANGTAGIDGTSGQNLISLASEGKGGSIDITVGDGSGSNAALAASDVSLSANGQGDVSDGFPGNGTIAITNANGGSLPNAIEFNSLSAFANASFSNLGGAGITIDAGIGGINVANGALLNSSGDVTITSTGAGKLAVDGDIDVFSSSNIAISHVGGSGEAIRSRRGTYTASGNIRAGLGIASGDKTIIRASDSLFLQSFFGSISADRLISVNDVTAFANQSATIGSATVTGTPSNSGSLTGGLIDIRAGYDVFSSEYNFATASISGGLTATGSIQIRSGGDIIVGGSAALRSDNFISLQSGGDIVVGSGATLTSALNVLPDMGYGTLGDISVLAGAITPSSVPADDISSIVAGSAQFSAAGHSIILNSDAIQATNATFSSRDFSATINNAPLLGAPRGNDRGLLTTPCLAGNICVGAITATMAVNLGAPSGLIGLPNQVFTFGNIIGDIITIRANDTIEFGSSARVASVNSLFVASLGGDVNITPTTALDSGASSLRLFAGGRINGAGVSLATSNNIGLGATGGITLENLDVGNTLFTIDSGGATTNANALITPGDVFIGSTLTGRTSDIVISADAGISVGTARVMSGANLNLTATNGNLFLGTAEATAGISGPSNISLQGLNILSNDLTAAGLIQLVATNSILGTNSMNAGGALTLRTELGAIEGATLIGNSVSLNSATSVTTGNVTATAGDIAITTFGAISTLDLTASSGSVSLINQVGPITAGLISARNDFTLTTGSDLTFGGVSVGDDIRITTTGTASLGRLTTTGEGTDNDDDASNIVISAVGALSVMHGQSDNDFTATAARFETGLNTIIAAGDITVSTVGDALLGNSQAGGFINVNAGGLIDFNAISAGDRIDLIAAAGITGGTARANTFLNLRGSAILTGLATAGNALSMVSTAGSITTGDLAAGSNLILTSATSISAGNIGSQGASIGINAQSNIATNAVTARSGSVSFASVSGGVTLAFVEAGNDATIGAGASVSVAGIQAGDDIRVTSGGASLLPILTATGGGADNDADGSNITVTSTGTATITNALAIHDITIRGSAGLSANRLTAGNLIDVSVAGNANITTAIAGISASDARRVVVDAQSNSVTDGVGVVTFNVTAGETITISSSTSDLWSAGPLPRFSSADGLIAPLFASTANDSGAANGTQIGDNFGDYSFGNLSAPFGSLVGEINGNYQAIGANSTFVAAQTGTLRLVYWDELSSDNSGAIAFTLTRAPTIIPGLGLINIRSGQNVNIGLAQAGGNITTSSGGTTGFTSFTSGAATQIGAIGVVTGGNVAAGTSLIINGAGLAIGDATAGSALALTSVTGGVTAANLSGENVTIASATGVDISGTTSAANTVLVSGTGPIMLATALAGGNIQISGGDLVSLGSATANGTYLNNGVAADGNLFVQSTGDVSITTATARTSIGIASVGVTGTGLWNAGEDIMLRATGAVTLNSLSAGDDIEISGGTTISLTTGTSRGDGRDGREVSFAPTGITIIGSGTGDGSDISLGASGDIAATNLTAADDINIATLANFSATGLLRTTGAVAGNGDSDIEISAGGGAATAAIEAFSDFEVDAASFSGSSPIVAGEDIELNTTGAVTATTLSAGDDVRITSTFGGIGFTSATAQGIGPDDEFGGGDVRLRSTSGSITIGDATAGDEVDFATGGDIQATSLTATGSGPDGDGSNVEVRADGLLRVDTITANNDLIAVAGGALFIINPTTAGNDVTISGLSVGISDATAGGALSITSTTGGLFARDLRSRTDTSLNSAGILTVGNVTSTIGNINISSQAGINARDLSAVLGSVNLNNMSGAIDTGLITVANDFDLTNIGQIVLRGVLAGDDVTISGSGLTNVGTVTTTAAGTDNDSNGSNIVVSGPTVSFIALNSHDDATLSGGAINGTSIMSRGATSVSGTGQVGIGSANAGTSLMIAGSALTIGNGVATNALAYSTMMGNIIAGDVSGGSVNLNSAAALTTGNVTAAMMDVSLTAQSNINSGVIAASLGNATLSTPNGMISVGQTSAGRALSLDASGAIAATGSLSGGQSLTLSGASIGILGATSGGATRITARSGGVVAGALSGTSLLAVTGVSGVSLGNVASANGDILLSSTGGGVAYADANAGQNLIVTALGDIAQSGAAIVARDARFNGGNVRIASITVGDDLDIMSAGLVDLTAATTLRSPIDLGYGSMSDDSNIAINGAGAVTAGTLRAVDNLTITSGSLAATSLTAGQTLLATIAGGSNIGTANGASLVQVNTASANRVGTATSASGDVLLSATIGNINLGATNAGRDISLNALAGNVTQTGTATAARSVTIVGNDVSLATVTAGDDIGVSATGALTTASLTTTGTAPSLGLGSDITLNAASAHITNTNAFGALTINTTGNAALGTSRAGTTLTVSGGSINAGMTTAGTALTLTSTSGDIVATDLTGGGVTVNSAGLLTAGNIIATSADVSLTAVTGINAGDINASLGSVSLTNGTGSIATGLITARNDFTLSTGSDLNFGGVSVGDDIRITTTGVATLGRLTTTGAGTDNEGDQSNIALNAGGALSVVHAESANDFTATAARFETGLTTIITAGDIDITTSGDSLLGNSQAGGFITVNAGGLIGFNTIRSGGLTSLIAGTSVTGTQATSGSGFGARAGSGMTIGGITAAGGVSTITLGGDTRLGSVGSVGTIRYTSSGGGGINATSSTAAGNIIVIGQGAVALGTATASGTLVNNGMTADGNIFVQTVGDATLGTATARSMIGIRANNISGTGLWSAGEDINVGASGGVSLTNVTAGDDVDIVATSGISLASATARGDGRDDRAVQLITNTATNSAQLGIVSAPSDGADIRLASTNGGSLSATNLTAADDIIVSTTASATVTGIARTRGAGVTGGASDISINAGTAVLSNTDAFDNLAVTTSGAATLGTSRAGTTIATSSGGTTGFTSLTSGTSTQIGAIGAVTGGNVAAGTSLTINGASVSVGNASAGSALTLTSNSGGIIATNLTGQNIIVGSSAGLNLIGTTNAANDVTISAAGPITLVTTMAGDDIHVSGAATSLSLGAMTTSGTGIDNDGDGSNITAASNGAADFGSLTSAGLIRVSSVGSIMGGDASAAGSIEIDAGTALTIGSATSTAGGIALDASNAVTATSLTAAQSVEIETDGSVTVTTINAALAAPVSSDIQGVSIQAGGNINLGSATADNIGLGSLGSVTANSLTAENLVAVFAGTSVDVDTVSTNGSFYIANASVLQGIGGFENVTGPQSFSGIAQTPTGGTVTLGTANAGSIQIAANSVMAGSLSGMSLLEVAGVSGTSLGNVASANGDILLSSTGGGVAYADANAGQNLIVTALGDIAQSGAAIVARDARFNGGNVRIASITVGDDLDIMSAGLVDLTAATTLRSPIDLGYGSMSDDSNIAINGAGAVTAGTLRAVDNVTITSGSLAATSLTAGQTLLATIAGGSNIGTANGASLVQINTGSANRIGTATSANGDVLLSATTGSIDLGAATTGRDLRLSALVGGVTQTGMASAVRDVLVNANNVSLASIAAGDDIDVMAAGSATIGSALTTSSGSDPSNILVTTGSTLGFTTINAVSNIVIAAGGGISGGDASAGNAIGFSAGNTSVFGTVSADGGVTGATSAGNLTTGSVSGGAGVTLNGAGALTTRAITSSRGNVELVARDALTTGDISAAAGSIRLTNGAALITTGALIARDDFVLSTGGALDFAGISVGDDISITAAGEARLGALTTTGLGVDSENNRGNISLAIGGALSASTINAHGGILANVVGTVTAANLNASTRVAVTSSGGAVTLADVESIGGAVSVTANGLMNVGNVRAAGSVNLSGTSAINAGNLTAGTGPLIASGGFASGGGSGSDLAPAGIAPGFDDFLVQRCDDCFTGAINLPFNLNFFGLDRSQTFVSNNGYLTFNSGQGTFTPSGLGVGYVGQPIIAAFFADVDTRNGASSQVTYGPGTFAGRTAFGATYQNVGYFSNRADLLNSFQIVLTDRVDTGAGNFDIYYNYTGIRWETGSASNGINGFGGISAAVGFNAGTGNQPNTFFELPGSRIPGSFLNNAPQQLITTTNNGTPGQLLFVVRNGQVAQADSVEVPGVRVSNVSAGDGADVHLGNLSGELVNVRSAGAAVLGNSDVGDRGSGLSSGDRLTTTIEAATNVTAGDVSGSGAVLIRATEGALRAGAITSGSSLVGIAGGALSFTGASNVATSATLSGGSITLAAPITAGTTITGTTTGLARIANAVAGEAFTLNAGQTDLGIVRAESVAIASGQDVIFDQLVSRGLTTITAGDEIAGNLINSTGALSATAGGNITVPTITAGSVVAQSGGTATITSLTSTGGASVSASNGITIASTAIGGALSLAASNGAVLISTDARAVGPIEATGRDVSLTTIEALTVTSATATNGNVALTSGGNLTLATGQSSGSIRLTSTSGDVSGATLTASGGDIIVSGRNATLNGVSDARGAIMITTPGLATLSGRALATTVDVRSGNIAVGATAQIGAQGRTATANFTNIGNSQTVIGGAGVQTGYSLSNAELGRVFANDIVINAPRIGQDTASTSQVSLALNNRAPDVILDTLTLTGANGVSGATAGNIGTGGRFTINTAGKLRTVGAATISNLTSNNRFIINASDAIEIDAATGLIHLRDAADGLAGNLVLTSANVIAASQSAISDVTGATDIAAINDRLARNDGTTIDEGYLRADTITVTVGNGFFVQNSGVNSPNLRNFDDRRGLTVGAGGLRIIAERPTASIVINGRQITGTGTFTQGVDFLRMASINGGTIALGTVPTGLFTTGSTINGCAILSVASCQISFDSGNIARDTIEEAILEAQKSKLPDALFEVKEAAEIDFQPLIDDPVTGAGNDDNWAIDDKADCAPGDESCAAPQ